MKLNDAGTQPLHACLAYVGVAFSTAAVSYFYLIDHWLFTSRSMSRIFDYLLISQDFHTAWISLGICILAGFWKKPDPINRAMDFVSVRPLAVAGAATVGFSLGAVFVYRNTALSMDEYAAVFQAKVFAAGHLAAQLPPPVIDWLVPSGFNGQFLLASHTTGAAIEAYWPGFSLLLAPFEFANMPWACNSLLAALALLLMYRITFTITGEKRAAAWSLCFALASGAFVANAISSYSMQAHLTANLLFACFLMRPTMKRAALAGVVGSLALVLHNPVPHALFAAPWLIAYCFIAERRRYLLPIVLGYLPLTLLLGMGWIGFRAHLIASDPGFGAIFNGAASAFSLPDESIFNIRVAAAIKMWIWAVPCLYLFAVAGVWRFSKDVHVRLLCASALATFAGYLFVTFDQGHGWGFRYFHSAFGVMPILAACALSERPFRRLQLTAFAGATIALNVLFVLPFQLHQIFAFITLHAAQLPARKMPGRNVYFVDTSKGFYIADLIQTDPLLRDDDLILRSRGAVLDEELRKQNWPSARTVGSRDGVVEWHVSDEPRAAGISFSLKYLDGASAP